MYLNAEMSYGYNEKLFIHGADLFTLLLDHKKTLKILNNLIENNSSSKIAVDVSPERDGKSDAVEIKLFLEEKGYEVRLRKYMDMMLYARKISERINP